MEVNDLYNDIFAPNAAVRRFAATAVKRASPRPVHGVPLPRPVRAGGGAQSRPIRAGRCPAERAQLAAQHCSAHGCGPQDDCQTDKKAALPSPFLLPRRSAQAQRKRWEVLELGEWWSFVGHKRRKVWRWLVIERARRRVGGWAAGAKPRCASGGSRCRRITTNIVVHYLPQSIAGRISFSNHDITSCFLSAET